MAQPISNDAQLQLLTEVARQRVKEHSHTEYPDSYEGWRELLTDRADWLKNRLEKECHEGGDADSKDFLHKESMLFVTALMSFMEFNYHHRQGTPPKGFLTRDKEFHLTRDPNAVPSRPGGLAFDDLED